MLALTETTERSVFTKALERRVKRVFSVIVLATAVSTLGPAADSFFVFSSDFRIHAPNQGGMSVIQKSGFMPGWVVITIAPGVRNQTMTARETQQTALM